MKDKMRIILASASPRRRDLFGLITDEFEIIPSDADETIPDDMMPDAAAQYLSRKKAECVYSYNKDALVIGCDTMVLLDGCIFGKPADAEDCKNMLGRLSGKVHKVITGVTIMADEINHSFSEVTEVEFYSLSEAEIEDYTASDEPFDKAGGYAIQGKGGLFVKGIKGDYNNVVGLPVSRLWREMLGIAIPKPLPSFLKKA